ncbi:hypothetical protein [Nocardiopsis sp. L17-MgMaSL7]|uniref:hypothetical protein n=1 Tax=Nocardiopsis sp. L17-MgMaSL7 TaxID=1938893 RepID=UPI000D70988D|nr:hypothetical protein [Nocardiopsis sp. L17-MgMaSL7]PWV44591.1 hypothetical protein BDW27_12350 [Nocardiopsis sp. L17-MgMaSL7]
MSETTPSTTHVRLIGGPEDWREQLLDHLTEADLQAPRESLGGYLISSHVPADHPDPGARAVYEPDSEPMRADLWFFRGWVPLGPYDPELRRADRHQGVTVVLDHDGLVVEWTSDDGVHRVDRVLAHWEASGEDDLGADVWHVRSAGVDWELRHHAPDMWDAGQLLTSET